jgi:hypothetical protein
MRKLQIALCAVVIQCFPAALLAQRPALEIPQVVSSAKSSLVLIKAYDESGLLQQGSGFRISGGRIATNAHVVANATRVEVFNDEGKLIGTSQYAEALSSSVDIAILPRLGSSGVALPLSATTPATGEHIVVLGAPEGLTNTVSDGIVSAIRPLDGQTLIQISAPISPGSSGGPVLNMRGEVIGVSVATYREGQNLNFAVPVSDLFAVSNSPVGRFAFPKERSSSQRASNNERSEFSGDIRLGVPRNASLDGSGFVLRNGDFADIYGFEGRAGQQISISARSDDFDAMVSIARFIGDSIDEVGSDDDGGGGTNPLLNVTLPATSRYLISVTAHDSSAKRSGRYVIDVRAGYRPRVSTRSSSPSATSDRWMFAAASDSTVYGIDRTSLKLLGTAVVQYWVKATHQAPITDAAGDTFDSELFQEEANCSRRELRSASHYQYLSGSPVYSPRTSTMGSWHPAVPGSIGEGRLDTACTLGGFRR